MVTVTSILTSLAMLTSAACMCFLFRAYASTRLRLLLFSVHGLRHGQGGIVLSRSGVP